VGQLAPDIEQIEVGLLIEAVVFADQASRVSGLLPYTERVEFIFGHQRLISPASC
jgi:hypothetical protein